MSETIKITERNSETSLPKGKRSILSFPSNFLVPCKITEEEDSFAVEYYVDGLYSYEDIAELPETEKYRFLYNCGVLKSLTRDFVISIAPENIYADINLMPKVLKRDPGKTNLKAFLEEYKALFGSLIAPKYKFDDYYEGGGDLYEANKKLNEICKEDSLEAMQQKLLKKYLKSYQYVKEKKTQVSKSSRRVYRILVPVLATITAFCIGIAAYLYFYRRPLDESLIHGHEAYLQNDFMAVQEALSVVSLENMPDATKYILSRSYVMSESLNVAQKESVLETLLPQTEALFFDYWIRLGRMEFDEAVDIAQRIGDDQLLLLAYIKYKAFLETETQTLTGSEKTEKLNELDRQIEDISQKLDVEEEE